VLGLSAVPVQAVLFHATDDPAFNSTAPGGSLTNSGWQYQGTWGDVLGIPIAPKYFLTAKHVGGSIGNALVFQGISYPTTAVFDDPETDLRLWRVCGTFPLHAPIYTNRDEVGKSLVVFGRGTRRGPVVTTTLLTQTRTNGWQWSFYDGVMRWGENTVAQIVDAVDVTGASVGQLLAATFEAGQGPNECHLSVGDSSGGLFLQDGAEWKLAGVNYAVDGPYNTASSGEGFPAAVFDEGGLYKSVAGNWVAIPDLPLPQPGSFYATRISSRLEWINSVLASSIPPDPPPSLVSAPVANGTYATVPSAIVDETRRTITLPQPSGTQFFQLRSCTLLRIASIRIEGGDLVLTYE